MDTFRPNVDGYYDVSDQMIRDLQNRAAEAFRRQAEAKAALTSIEAFEAHRKRVRDAFFAAIGGLPEERTPLNVQCTGTLDRGTFTIEKLLYESLPEFYVTAILYVPKGVTSPRPAVVFVHGHADNGKAYERYQAVCVDLVQNGFVILAVDPPGQGERFQYLDPKTGERIIGGCTTEHTHAGLQFTVAGASIARHFIWDTMRGIDYLETRPEVDPTRIGLTGNSGGGTQSCFLMISEPRLAAAVPCTFVMTLESYLKTGQAQDSEQIVRGCFVNGPDHDDYLTAMAPKPVRVGAAAYDFFPIEGTIEAVARAKRVYALFSAEENVDLAVAPTTHQYSPQLRQACVNWFRQHLMGESPDFVTGEPETLPDEDLWVTPKGQVLLLHPKSRTVFDLNRERVAERPLSPLDADGARAAVREVLAVPTDRESPIYPRVISDREVDGYRTEKVFFFSAPDVVVTGILIHPTAGTKVTRTDLVLFENGTSEIPDRKAWLRKRLDEGRRLFVFDVRGIGAVAFRTFSGNAGRDRGSYRLASDAMMLELSTLGLRVYDVLRGYDYLRTRPDVDDIGIVGMGRGAFFAYFAAALEEGFTRIEVVDLLYAYRDWIETRYYDQGRFNLDVAAWGILRRFDLVDLVPCFGGRPVHWIAPRNAMGEVLTAEAFEERFLRVARERGYRVNGVAYEAIEVE